MLSVKLANVRFVHLLININDLHYARSSRQCFMTSYNGLFNTSQISIIKCLSSNHEKTSTNFDITFGTTNV